MRGSVGRVRLVVVGAVVGLLGSVMALAPMAEAAPAAPVEEQPEGGADPNGLPFVSPPVNPDLRPNSGPLSPPVEPNTVSAAPTPLDVALDTARSSGQSVPVPELTSETSTVTANPDGTVTNETATAPVRVETAEGWVPVDTTLVASDGGVAPAAVPFDVSVSAGGSDPLVTLSDDDPTPAAEDAQSVTLDVTGQLPAPVLDGNKATYLGAAQGSDLVVTASPIGTEVSVVIPDAATAAASYELDLGLENLSVSQNADGALVFKDDNGKATGYSPAPILFDSTATPLPGLASNPGEIGSELVRRNGRTILVVTPDPAYLEDPTTQYPVTIDPAADLSDLIDNLVLAGSPTTAYDSIDTMFIGTNPLTGVGRGLVKFNTARFEDAQVTSATLKLWQNWAGSCAVSDVTVRAVNSFSAGVTWNTKPADIAGLSTFANVAGPATGCTANEGVKNVPLTGIAQYWASDASTTGQVVLLSHEADSTKGKGFDTRENAHPPALSITYYVKPTISQISPANNSKVTTLRPTLKAKVTATSWSGNVDTTFSVRNSASTEIAATTVAQPSGATPTYTVPKDKLRPGQTYTWTVKSCTEPSPPASTCTTSAVQSFTVNQALATGSRGFFTYDTTGISDRSSVSVNVASGNLMVNASDLSVAGVGPSVSMVRTYNSLGANNGLYGHRWTGSMSTDVRLEPEVDGGLTYYGETGEAVRIAKSGTTYTPSGDLDARFVDAGGFGVYVLEFNHDRGPHKAGDAMYFYNSGSLQYKLYGVRNKNNQSIRYNYNATTFALESITDSRSRSFTYTTSGGHITKIDDAYTPAADREVNFSYDGSGDLDTVTDADGVVTNYDYTGHDLTKITILPGSNQRVIDIGYDAAHRVTSISRTVSGVTETSSFTYNDTPAGVKFSSTATDAENHATTYLADYAHRVTSATDALGKAVSKNYDDNSNIIDITDAASQTSTSEFDVNNNLKSTTSATGVSSSANYTGTLSGSLATYQPKTATDAQSNTTSFTYDTATSDPKRATAPGGTYNELTYNPAFADPQGPMTCGGRPGQPCTSRDRLGRITSSTYNAKGELITVTPPSSLEPTEFTYDALSRISTVTDGKNQVRTFTYDKLDRVLTVTYGSSPGTVFSYGHDKFGNVTSRTDPSGTWAMDFNEANRLTATDGPAAANDVDYTFDRVGNLKQLSDLGGTTAYTFTDINMVKTITDPDSGVTTYTYDTDHPTWLTNVAYPNGATAVYVRDEDGRITGVTNTETSGGNIIDQLTYSWKDGSTPKGLRQSVSAPLLNRKTKYTYNTDNRLTAVATETLTPANTATSPTWAFGYDAVGNRTSSTLNGGTSAFTYNNADELTTTGVTHDDNGNMTNGGAHGYGSMTYNAMDQTTDNTPKVPGTSRTETYAGTGQSSWLSSGGLTFTTAASIGITAIGDQTTSTTTTFVRDPSGRLVSMERAGERFYYHFDGRGSVSALTDDTGHKNQAYTYQPYGRLESKITVPPAVDQPFRWNSEYALNDYDYKVGARWYDASIGRWTQRDPSGQDPNAYAFGDNDPVNNADPTGLSFLGVDCPFGETDSGGCNGADQAKECVIGGAQGAAISSITGGGALAGAAGGCVQGAGIATLRNNGEDFIADGFEIGGWAIDGLTVTSWLAKVT